MQFLLWWTDITARLWEGNVIIDESCHQSMLGTLLLTVLICHIHFRYIPHSFLRYLGWRNSKESTSTQESQFSNPLSWSLPEHDAWTWNPVVSTKGAFMPIGIPFSIYFRKYQQTDSVEPVHLHKISTKMCLDRRPCCYTNRDEEEENPSWKIRCWQLSFLLAIRFRFTFENISK